MSELTAHRHGDDDSVLTAHDFGAHLTQWTVDGVDRLWLSPAAVLDGSTPIRGGVPICLPWFADGPHGGLRPSHGLARTATWHPVDTVGVEVLAWQLDSRDLADSPGAEHLPGPFLARYAVTLDSDGDGDGPTLRLRLDLRNTGPLPYRAEVALHTYLAVQDVREVRLHGLEGVPYLDKVSGAPSVAGDEPLELTAETDRIYEAARTVRVEDRAALRTTVVEPAGAAAQTVVWNPWEHKAGAMADVGAEAWLRFVCVETVARGEGALHLAPGDTIGLGCAISGHAAPAS